MVNSEERATEELSRTLGAIRQVGGQTLQADLQANHAIAQNVLREELGTYGAWSGTNYHLNQATRDVLLAHARQDAANAMTNTHSILRRIDHLERQVRRAFWVFALLLLLVAAVRFL